MGQCRRGSAEEEKSKAQSERGSADGAARKRKYPRSRVEGAARMGQRGWAVRKNTLLSSSPSSRVNNPVLISRFSGESFSEGFSASK